MGTSICVSIGFIIIIIIFPIAQFRGAKVFKFLDNLWYNEVSDNW